MNKYCQLLICFLFLNLNPLFSSGAFQAKNEASKILEIPFEYVEGLIVIKAKVNGVEGRFLFDNGASFSCFNKDFAKKSNVAFRKRVRITDGNNNKTYVGVAKVKKIEISKAVFSKTSAYSIDTKKFFPCDAIDGIIGASIINAANWKIDFEKKKMLISLTPFNSDGLKMKMKIVSNNSSFINFNINGSLLKTKIDLGFKGELKINKYRNKLPLKGKKAEKTIGISSLSVTGLGNIDTTYIFHRNFELRYSDNTLPVSPEITLTKYLKYDARIGLDYFKKYDIIINSTTREYILSNPKSTKNMAIEKSYGIAIYTVKDVYKIIRIHPEETFSFPLKLMDEIVKIDNKTMVSFDDLCDFKDYLNEKRKNEASLLIQLKGTTENIEIPYKAPLLKTLK